MHVQVPKKLTVNASEYKEDRAWVIKGEKRGSQLSAKCMFWSKSMRYNWNKYRQMPRILRSNSLAAHLFYLIVFFLSSSWGWGQMWGTVGVIGEYSGCCMQPNQRFTASYLVLCLISMVLTLPPRDWPEIWCYFHKCAILHLYSLIYVCWFWLTHM